MSALVNFYDGTGTDHAGRKLKEIVAWNDDALESTHDYIQWLFPNRTASMFNSEAPLLTDEDVKTIRESSVLMARFSMIVFARMRTFYKIDQGPPYWWDDRSYSHNWLRMTRILLSLREFGLDEEAASFFESINKASLPDDRTRKFWSQAAGEL